METIRSFEKEVEELCHMWPKEWIKWDLRVHMTYDIKLVIWMNEGEENMKISVEIDLVSCRLVLHSIISIR